MRRWIIDNQHTCDLKCQKENSHLEFLPIRETVTQLGLPAEQLILR
jgi:hypothetical protein